VKVCKELEVYLQAVFDLFVNTYVIGFTLRPIEENRSASLIGGWLGWSLSQSEFSDGQKLLLPLTEIYYIILRYVILCYVILYCVMLSYAMLCYAMLCCYVTLRYFILCYVFMLRYVKLRYVTLCYVTLCYVMLCYVMLCYVMLCYAMYLKKRAAFC